MQLFAVQTGGNNAQRYIDRTASATLTSDDNRTVQTNTGATSKPVLTLPASPAVGTQITFIVTDTDGMRVLANTGQTIRLGGLITKSAGYVESLDVGSSLILFAESATKWVAYDIVGPWLIERASDTIYAAGAGWSAFSWANGLGGATNGIVAGGATRFLSVQGAGCLAIATEAPVEHKTHSAGRITNIRVYLSAIATVGDPVIVLRKNGADTTITVTIPAGSSAGWYDLAGAAVDFAEGDRLAISCVNGATGNTTFNQISIRGLLT